MTYPFEYTYNSANTVETIKYPFSNRQVTTCYDQAGRVLAVKNGGMTSADIYAEVTAGTDPETGATVEAYDPKGGLLRGIRAIHVYP